MQNQPFTYTRSGTEKHSQNVVAEPKGQSDKVILIGAHHDSTGEKKGSEGATDNGAGVAALLAVAEALKDQTLPHTVRFLPSSGPRENGLNGSRAYAASLDGAAVAKLLAMVNYDTIAGGDIVYVHSAHLTWPSTTVPTRAATVSIPKCATACWPSPGRRRPLRHPPQLRRLRGGDRQLVPITRCLACLGVPHRLCGGHPNFTINGEAGYDGYSQSTNPALWDCYDDATKSACDRDTARPSGQDLAYRARPPDRMAELFPEPHRAAARGQHRSDDPFPERTRALIPGRSGRAFAPPASVEAIKFLAGVKPALLWIL